MTDKAYLVLEDGSVFEGASFGAKVEVYGEVVFNTSMTGYQEVLTDPSYGGQIVLLTYPLIGNYGVNQGDVESARIQVAGFIVREQCAEPSHYDSQGTVSDFLAKGKVPGISEVDTRAITRRLRSRGVLMGALTISAPEEALKRLRNAPQYADTDFVRLVSTKKAYTWQKAKNAPPADYRILVSDCGVKFNILRMLQQRGCEVIACPASMSAPDILALKPDGIILSPGPGDPAHLDYVVDTAKGLVGKKPIFGICLGNQVIARAFGGKTFKLKFGHRGGNHPVKDLADGKVSITAQNHGYAVDAEGLPPGLEVSHLNLNDNTVEGLRHREYPIMTIQYHSEASPGPRDNEHLFDRFLGMVRDAK